MAGVATYIFVALALLATTLVVIQAVRRPILWSMAARNAARRPRQTATVIAGLMVGTAIISAALVAGQSAGTAIRGAVYEALGEVDETVRLDAFNYYDESVLDAYLADPDAIAFFDGISANAIWDGAVTNPRTDLFEPAVAVVGFDPERDADFRPFELTDGTEWDGIGLRPGEAIITDELAEETELQVGDRLELRYTPPLDPLLPDVVAVEGVATGTSGVLPLLGIEDPAASAFPIEVEPGADSIVSVVGWDPRVAGTAPGQSLTVTLTDPGGRTTAVVGTPTSRPPVWINVTDGPIEPGTWTLRVSGVVAAQVPYQGALVALYPVYDAAELRARASQLEQGETGGPASEIAESLASFLSPRTLELDVVAITDGGRGHQFDFDKTVFIDMETAQDAWDRQGEVNVIKFSNPGDMVSGRDATEQAIAILNATLAQVKEDNPDDGAIQNLVIRPVKRDFIQLADDSGQLMTALLLFAGSLSVITGLLLIINIFTMLAEERRSELGMARAVGMTRRDIVRLFLFEGSLYAVAAAAIGSILGLGLAALMVAILNAILANLGGDFPPIGLKITLDALLLAFSAGTILAFATIAIASRRIARLNIVRAIRRIDEPEKTGTRLQVNAGILLAVVGLGTGILGWVIRILRGDAEDLGGFTYEFSLQIFGPLALIIGAALALRPVARRRVLYPSLAATLFFYYTLTYFVITKYTNVTEANIVGPIRGVIMTLCVVVVMSYFEAGPRAIGRIMGRFRRWRAVALPAVSYPQHKRFRTGMTLAMFSIVILSIGFFSIFGALFDTDPDQQTGGFDIEATTTLDVEDLAEFDRGLIPSGTFSDVVRVDDFFTPDVGLITVEGERTGQFSARVGHHVYGVDEQFIEAQEFRLLWRLPEYASDDDAYQALMERDDVVIVAYTYSTNERNQDLSHEVGDTLAIELGDEPREFTIIGIQEQFHFSGIFLSKAVVSGLFPTTTDGFYLYRLVDDSDAPAVAKLLEQNYRDVGMNAEASREKVVEEQQTFRQILGAMKLFLGLGLIVGVLSLGIVTARSVIERRQEIGMLRALGFTPGMIRRIFLTEMTMVVALGAAIGLACSIIVSFGLWYSIIRELQYPYVIPWGEIGILVGVSYFVALLATIAPIRRAAKVAPAEALRYIE